MNQYDLNHLFQRFEQALKASRALRQLKANDFMLVSIEPSGICHFRHLETKLEIRFDAKKKIVLK